jgi:hypothetical protein
MRPAGHLSLAPGARAAIRNYGAIHPWLRDDLAQEAALAVLEARAKRPGEALAEATIAARELYLFVAESNSPVHLPDHRDEAWKWAASAEREPLEVQRHGHDGEYASEHRDVAAVAAQQWRPLEDRLDDARAMAEVRRILEAEGEAAKAVLLAEEKPAAVAARLRLSRRQVYKRTARAMERLRAALVQMEVAA